MLSKFMEDVEIFNESQSSNRDRTYIVHSLTDAEKSGDLADVAIGIMGAGLFSSLEKKMITVVYWNDQKVIDKKIDELKKQGREIYGVFPEKDYKQATKLAAKKFKEEQKASK